MSFFEVMEMVSLCWTLRLAAENEMTEDRLTVEISFVMQMT